MNNLRRLKFSLNNLNFIQVLTGKTFAGPRGSGIESCTQEVHGAISMS